MSAPRASTHKPLGVKTFLDGLMSHSGLPPANTNALLGNHPGHHGNAPDMLRPASMARACHGAG